MCQARVLPPPRSRSTSAASAGPSGHEPDWQDSRLGPRSILTGAVQLSGDRREALTPGRTRKGKEKVQETKKVNMNVEFLQGLDTWVHFLQMCESPLGCLSTVSRFCFSLFSICFFLNLRTTADSRLLHPQRDAWIPLISQTTAVSAHLIQGDGAEWADGFSLLSCVCFADGRELPLPSNLLS